MEYDSVLGQQSISGKNVSLILCVCKPCYVKSGHIYTYIFFCGRAHAPCAPLPHPPLLWLQTFLTLRAF